MRKHHLAALIAPDGSVSAACFTRPKPIDMRPESVETWTTDALAVSCEACKQTPRYLEQREKAEGT